MRREALLAAMLTLWSCSGGDSNAPSFEPDFPLGWEEVSSDGSFANGVTTESFVWRIHDARDRAVPGATVHLAAYQATVTPEVVHSDEAGRVAFSWSYVSQARPRGDFSELTYCLAYQEDCTPDRSYIVVEPNPD